MDIVKKIKDKYTREDLSRIEHNINILPSNKICIILPMTSEVPVMSSWWHTIMSRTMAKMAACSWKVGLMQTRSGR